MGVRMFDFIKRIRFWLTYPRHLPHPASREFLDTREWKELRYRAFLKYGNRCVVCGHSAKEGAVLNMDPQHGTCDRTSFALSHCWERRHAPP
jgi:hypothetical protein